MRFSERYGYITPRDALRRERLDQDIINSLCNCYSLLEQELQRLDRLYSRNTYSLLEEHVWCYFLNRLKSDFWSGARYVLAIENYLKNPSVEWYLKIDCLEFSVAALRMVCPSYIDVQGVLEPFIKLVNNDFKRLDYAYRFVGDTIVEVTDEVEIKEIEEALNTRPSVQTHLSSALTHLSNRQSPDYRNSIKESISAVEAVCREITRENTLGDALKQLEKKGVVISKKLQTAFEKLYNYTNDKTTGIRHALIEDTEAPSFDEAKFMLIACSAFINYIQAKNSLSA